MLMDRNGRARVAEQTFEAGCCIGLPHHFYIDRTC
jgi:hypothetical protein